MHDSEPSRSIGRRTVLGGTAVTGAGALLGSAALTGTAQAAGGPSAGGIDQRDIDRAAARLAPGAVRLRRAIHRHPELAGQERRTAALVAERLGRTGLRPVTGVGGHGVVALLKGARPGRTIAYRADMDAVPPDEQFEPGTARRVPAHVCGHDLHTAVGVGVAEVLARLRGRLRGNVLFVFQPAEETLRGARAMLDDGVLDGEHRADEIYAVHCGPFASGSLAVAPGVGLPGLDKYIIELAGPDAEARAARLAQRISALGTVQPAETTEDAEKLVRDLQRPDGPLAGFVLMHAGVAPGEGGGFRVQGAYRCWPEERWTRLRAEIRGLAAAEGAGEPTFPPEPFPAMINNPRLSEFAAGRFRHALGPRGALTMHAAFPFNGEDFSLFLRRVPGAMFFLGVRPEGGGVWESMPHSTAFTPDERAIGVGIRAIARLLSDRAAAAA
ncbi:M20/M25/M40 family metallo-hydrolase [Actinomadura sp. KC06]|uniref:M20 metallopeptidase family protein n=1 Tax=Actinomadura sp. KC06 TaxID=2530369 RepID=UPI00104B67DB|nr:M20/M25/M40 family metallo-hydrolase [Actinomadura sp. KC06]TDD31046.1 M20/M25/M40 family metallo-hydrolase [Actinomadura sp. KC06]